MRLLKKARQILRTHGIRGLLHRTGRHIRRQRAARAEAAAQRTAWEKLLSRVGNTRPVFFPRHEEPVVSIIIPVYNNFRYTAACLNSVLRELSMPCEVIVVDDGSTDETAEYLASCSGITIVPHGTNRGFVASINDGAAVARGRYLHLLNNDTIVTPGWMRALLRTFETRDRVAAVGSQLWAPDGSVSEAGALIWRDGNGANFGRGRNAKDPGVAFPREVDYCSAASLMVRADLFRDLGGLSEEFAPAYYEDVDLCFRLRAAGYRVLYQPSSVVVHFEGATSGTDSSSGVKRFQLEHRAIFAKKWAAELTKHFPPDVALIDRAARRLSGKSTVLVVDSFIPFDDRSAGGRRLLAIMRLMREIGWHVIFVADDGGEYEPYTTRARRAGIEVVPHRGDALGTIADLALHVDVAWVCRPDILEKYMSVLHRRTRARIVYDTVDLHFLRAQREEQLTGKRTEWQALREIEIGLMRKSDCIVVTSEAESALLAGDGFKTHVVPIIEQPVQTRTAYSVRQGLLFLANYTHEPNVDAAEWLVNAVMPRVWQRLPELHVTLAGAEPTPAVERLASEFVGVTGYVEDVRPLFERARAFVAPLRYGAGMKGKIVESLSYGLPVVTTTIGAEGVGLSSESDALIADDADAIAEAVVRLYTDEALWTQIAGNGRQAAARFTPAAVRLNLQRALEAALEQGENVGIDLGFSTHTA